MRLQFAGAVVEAGDIGCEMRDFGLNEMGLLAHAGIAQHRLNDLDGQHQQRWGDDDDAGPVGFLHQILEILVELGKNAFRWHEEKGRILRFSRNEVTLPDILNVLGEITPELRLRLF